jgi:hypothetical protein
MITEKLTAVFSHYCITHVYTYIRKGVGKKLSVTRKQPTYNPIDCHTVTFSCHLLQVCH